MFSVYLSNSYNPYFNISIEKYLFENSNNKNILFLWQNENTVVIGKNQNPWKECNISKINDDNINLVRRFSGGGAVYHDLGNLNFTFISKYHKKCLENNINLIINALESLNIKGYFSGKNDLLVDEYKVSGNAFYVEDDILIHHGTLLVNTDLNKLTTYLNPSIKKIKSKGIDSIRSRVKNLKSFNSDLTITMLKEAIIREFIKGEKFVCEYLCEDNVLDLDDTIIKKEEEKLTNWNWNYGYSPEFNVHINKRFHWGEVNLYLLVENGLIHNVEVFSDALDVGLPDKIKTKITQTKFDYQFLLSYLKEINKIDIF